MEQQNPRNNFLLNFNDFIKNVDFSEKFNNVLCNYLDKKDNNKILETISKFETVMEKKIFIFLEFTRDRSTCNDMINILCESGQKELANQLQQYNMSPNFIEFSNEINIEITKANVKRSGESKYFKFEGAPRGLCIIINNVREVLEKETLRFENVFIQLGFEVLLWYNLTASQIKEQLIYVSKLGRLTSDQAIIVMTIAHGVDDRIMCLNESDIRVSEIINHFIDDNCPALYRKPKLFFFNCCEPNLKGYEDTTQTLKSKFDWLKMNPGKTFSYVLVSYSFSEGNWSVKEDYEISDFGQAFSHCIAQYACDKTLEAILKLTSERLPPNISPEIRQWKMTKELYLNPGF